MTAPLGPKMECCVCWYVYDPEVGDGVWSVPPQTAFRDLPPDWKCPVCDAPPERFLEVCGD